MIKKLQLIILISLLCTVLLSLESAYGLAGSLEELENELDVKTGYRAELQNYIISHNMTVYNDYDYPANLNTLELYELEEIVKKHIEDCRSGLHDSVVEMINNSDNKSKLLDVFGDC